jgi:hypothetical protein
MAETGSRLLKRSGRFLLQRRAWVRYGSDGQAVCQIHSRGKDMGWIARVRDISEGGIGLLLRHRFRRGTPLLVELGSAAGPSRVIAVHVAHVTPVRTDGAPWWLVGCAFDEELTPVELQAFRERLGT